jgi:EmrB/QacA subfamily drug resistance transporter
MSVQPDHDRRWKTLGVLGLSLVLIGLDNTVLNVALPSMQRELDASASVLQWMVDAYLLVFAGLLLIAGTLGDRHGRKRALQAGLVVFGLASAAALFASTGGHVIAARAVMGLGAAFIMPATLSIVIDVFPARSAGKAIGAWAGMAAIGSGLGPAIGGGLLEVASWQSVFALNLPVVALALVLGRRLVPESRDPAPGRLDLAGGALSVAALAVLVLTIIEAPEAGWTAGPTLAGFGIAAVLGAAFVWQERRTADPLLDVALFRLPSFSVASLAVAGAFFALFGMIFALTQFLQLAQGASPLEAGLKQMPVALGLVLSAPLSHLVVQRVGRRAVVAVGLVALAACLLSVSTWTPATSTTVVCLFAFLVAFAMGFVMGPATESVMNAVPEEHAGRRLGHERRQPHGGRGARRRGLGIRPVHGLREPDGGRDGRPPGARGRGGRRLHRGRGRRRRGAPAAGRRRPDRGGGCGLHGRHGDLPRRRGRRDRAHRRGGHALAARRRSRRGGRPGRRSHGRVPARRPADCLTCRTPPRGRRAAPAIRR